MKFCRNCGTSLAGAAAPAVPRAPTPGPSPFAGMPPSGPLSTLAPSSGPQPAGLPPTLPPGNTNPGMSPQQPSYAPPSAPAPLPVAGTPLAAVAPTPMPYGQEVPPTLIPGPSPVAAGRPLLPAGAIACPRCGVATPASFVYCQSCGLHIQAVAPTDPGPRPARPPALGSTPGVAPAAPVDVQAATLAVDPPRAAPPVIRPPTAGGVAWGTAVLVNRDGSDGARHALDAEYTVIGRAGADIAFEEDRFLARQHARLERSADGTVRVSPTDALNGVFRKADAPVDLTDGLVILVGREVLRFERVEAEERAVTPLIRHGVALFGSPPRDPWGRLIQILPSGGYRDIRHLSGEEVVLGREEGDIVFRDDAFMSRRHAAVTWDGKRAQLTDLGSSNGTFVRLTGTTAVKHGDHLRMGDQLLRIELAR